MRDTPETDARFDDCEDSCGNPWEAVDADFARRLERERDQLRKEMAEAWHLLNVLSLNMMDDGPTWPRVLEWIRRNENLRPQKQP